LLGPPFTRLLVEESFMSRVRSLNAALVGGAAVLGASGEAATAQPVGGREGLGVRPQSGNPVAVQVTRDQVQATNSGIVIQNPALADQLRSNRAAAIGVLQSRFPGLRDADVTLDARGRVLINQAAARATLAQEAASNINCNFICGRSARPAGGQ
jgi:hypothetical protein